MKKWKRILSILSVFCMLTVLFPAAALAAGPEPTFSDIAESAWYHNPVQYACENGLMTGTGAGIFEPETALTRAMFVTILGRMDGVDTELYPGSQFSDAAAGQWYSAYVQWAAQNEIVLGYGEGLFGSNDPVTREQMATMICRYLSMKGVTLPDSEQAVDSFKDMSSVSDWAQEGLELMRRTGLLTGDANGYYHPLNAADRAEAAALFSRLHQSLNQSGSSEIAQPSGSYTIGVCQLVSHSALDDSVQGFRDALTDHLGDAVTFDVQNAQGDVGNCARIVNSFAADGRDLILATASIALQTAAAATDEIPILGVSVSDYASALAIDDWTGHTGVNISGTADLISPDDQAALVRELFPDAKTVGVLYCAAESGSADQANAVTACLESRGCNVKTYTFSSSGDDVTAVTASACGVCDVLYIPFDTTALSFAETIHSVALPAGVPIVAGSEGMCYSCAAAALSVDYYALGRATGEMAYEVLVNGADISQMDVRYASDFTRIYNPEICEALGITVPDGYVAVGG